MTLNVVCVKWGTLYGAEYVNTLFDMVVRNLNNSHHFKFFCFTDDPEGLHGAIQIKKIPENLVGWWPKLYLFKDGLFPDGEQVIFIDLDTAVVSGLDKIFEYRGEFAILRDFLRKDGLGSAFMSWKAGKYGYVWDDYVGAEYPSIPGGDQAWIERYPFAKDIYQDLFPDCFVSYKKDCQETIPKGAKVVCFHGVPMPHQVTDGWVPNIWKEGGGSSLELEIHGNTLLDKIKENISFSLNEGIPVFDKQYAEHDKHAVIVGGAPSINSFVDEIKRRSEGGQDIIALNNCWKWLEKRGIKTAMQVMVDARPENVDFVPPSGSNILRLYATQCDHRLITLSKNENTLLWNSYLPELPDSFSDKNMLWVGSGTSVGLRSIFLLYMMGYRHFHIYGYDSSYQNEAGHAYEQKLNNGEKVLDVIVQGRTFKSAPWMITQAQEFLEVMEYMTGQGCQFTIHGDGLLQYMVKTCLTEGKRQTAAEGRAESLLNHLEGMESPVGVEVGVFAGELSRLLLERPDLMLNMVDSWVEHSKDSEYAKTDFHGGLNTDQQEAYYKMACNAVEFAGDRAVIHRMDSAEAAKKFENGSLDFIFLDADHTPEGIEKDLLAWLPKLKPEGVFSGHDYDHPNPKWGVKNAVDKMCQAHGFTLELGRNFTWFVHLNKREIKNGTC